GFGFDAPAIQPRHGIYHPDLPADASLADLRARHVAGPPTIGVLFYRSHLQSGNTDFVDALVREIEARKTNALPVYTYSLKDRTGEGELPDALRYFAGQVDTVIATLSFAM